MNTHTIYEGMSNVSARRQTRINTTISGMDCRDGGSLILIEQPNVNRNDLLENDIVALDDSVQERLYKYLHTKFGGA